MKRAILIIAFVGVIALPFLLRPRKPVLLQADQTIVVVTPHNEAIRSEFARGFQDWYKARTGRTVAIDWRVIGGTSEITRFLESEYISSFQNFWTNQLHHPWSIEVQAAFANGHLAADASSTAREARQAFLDSSVSCGIDVFFGGGSFDFMRQADAGRLVDTGLMQAHPEWFKPDIIPQSYTGQPYWDKQGRWIGAVLSSYGIIYNLDSLARLHIPGEPKAWDDLADPRYFGEVALCDPTKSSSIAQAFENVIQEQIYRELARLQKNGTADASVEPQAVRLGWENGLRLLERIGANARYFTDSSQKPPIDVQQGNSAAGMCIDFYGRAEEQSARERSGVRRLGFFTPPAGTVVSCDPIALLRGAPNREPAIAFIEYVLSLEGQKIWNFRPGTPDGPQRFALRRLPIRRDFYTHEEWRASRSDPDIDPYSGGNPLVYNAAWTGGIFREMAFVIRVMCQDCHDDLASAWKEIVRHGMPADALARFGDLSVVSYDQMNARIKPALNSKNKVDEVLLAKDLAAQFRRQYREAEDLARAHPIP
ncbi:MAG TPA: extracellular solute-binding protein [Candidatus Didemnitutus sp.]|nr:extracellular solute-binding protein [Candidatus Didemnitutus sp.]